MRMATRAAGKVTDDKFPAVVTSFEIANADSKALQRYNWKYVIVDEVRRWLRAVV